MQISQIVRWPPHRSRRAADEQQRIIA